MIKYIWISTFHKILKYGVVFRSDIINKKLNYNNFEIKFIVFLLYLWGGYNE